MRIVQSSRGDRSIQATNDFEKSINDLENGPWASPTLQLVGMHPPGKNLNQEIYVEYVLCFDFVGNVLVDVDIVFFCCQHGRQLDITLRANVPKVPRLPSTSLCEKCY